MTNPDAPGRSSSCHVCSFRRKKCSKDMTPGGNGCSTCRALNVICIPVRPEWWKEDNKRESFLRAFHEFTRDRRNTNPSVPPFSHEFQRTPALATLGYPNIYSVPVMIESRSHLSPPYLESHAGFSHPAFLTNDRHFQSGLSGASFPVSSGSHDNTHSMRTPHTPSSRTTLHDSASNIAAPTGSFHNTRFFSDSLHETATDSPINQYHPTLVYDRNYIIPFQLSSDVSMSDPLNGESIFHYNGDFLGQSNQAPSSNN